MRRTAALVLTASLSMVGCAGTIRPPAPAPERPVRDALLVLPGVGYGRDGERAIRALAPAMRRDGIDLYVPAYVSRSGLHESRENLRRFVREQRLDRYERVHVFAFLAGGWTFNSLTDDAQLLPNLGAVVYDRSPYQERAPRIAADKLKLLAWLRHGPLLFQLAKTPYPPLRREVKVGLLVETTPTPFVKRFASTARSYGPFTFECEALAQPHDDCIFVPLDHSQLYTRFAEVWPELRTFISSARFSAAANRVPPRHDALATARPGGHR